MQKTTQPVKLYVWSMSDTNPGHVSLEIESTYISYWPTGEDSETKDQIKNPPGKGNLKDFKVGVTHKASFPTSYRTDRRLERKEADHVLIINGLNAALMCERWEIFKADPKRYNMKNYNCSTVVASFLEIGSGVAYGKTPCIKIDHYEADPIKRLFYKLRFMGNSITMWTPNDVHLYALQIKSSKGFS
jgi:hypothetical protein